MPWEEILYRKAGLDDLEILSEGRIRMLCEVFDRPRDRTAAALLQATRDYLRRAIPAGEFIARLAEIPGRTVGVGGMVLWRRPPNFKAPDGRIGYILNMYTWPEFRGRGIATRLFRELVEEAKALGIGAFHLHASPDGMGIYRREGFREPPIIELEMSGRDPD